MISRQRALRVALAAFVLFVVPVSVLANSIDSVFKYAWGENIGWLNFGTSEGGVDVSASALTGYVWGENVGWISLNCSNSPSSCGTVDFKVANSGGTLSGYAWGENVGWISFSCSNTSTCGTVNYGVTVDTFTGDWSGYAWGENIGWVSMNCSNTSSCATVDYHVANIGILPPLGAGTGGALGGGGAPPALPPATVTPTPSMSVSPSPTASVSPLVSGGGSVTGGSRTGAPPRPRGPLASRPSGEVTPSTAPAPAAPAAPPPFFIAPPSFGPVTQVIDTIGGLVDRLDPVPIGAVAVTVLALIPLLAAAAASVVQNEVVASAFSFMQALGLVRKARTWGTLYDTATKHPVPFAKIQIIDATGRILETRFADRDGRYGFLTSPESLHQASLQVRILVAKDGYTFPSRNTGAGTDFLVYDHLYFGEQLEIRPGSYVQVNIPLDPVGPAVRSWGLLRSGLVSGITEKILDAGFVLGLFLVPLNYLWFHTSLNLAILVAFFAANAARIFVLYRPYGFTKDATTGAVIPFSLVTLNDPSGQRVGFTVSDERGRYFLPAERGKEYLLTAYTPANVQPQRTVTRRISPRSRTSRRAWVTLTLPV